MAGFKLEKLIGGRKVETIEMLPSNASETYTEGEILTLSSGKLAAAGDDTDGTQMFVCMKAYVAPSSGNLDLPVIRINPDMIFRVESYADNHSTAIGTLVTLHTDEAQVTATTSKGVFEITDLLGDGTADSDVLGRFPTAAGR